jgi:hypothetical protein
VDRNTVLALVLIAGLGIGGYLYFKRGGGTAQAATGPMVPERVAQKRAVGTAIANTSGSDTMRPDLPPQVQGAFDAAGAVYKRGSDLVTQGKQIGQQVTSGDFGGALTGAGSLVGSLTGGGYDPRHPAPGSTNKSSASDIFSPPPVAAKQAVGSIVAGGRTVSNVRDTAGNVYSSAKYSSTPEFQKLRAAADAAETRANVGASHF